MKITLPAKQSSLILLLTTLLLCCQSDHSNEIETATAYQAHVAFAGGGWRAHSGHSGWIIALLNNGNRTLDEAFDHVGSISSNSGGSWFSTMLMYSDDFGKAIQAVDADSTWATSGWLGLQEKHFNAAPCHMFSGDDFSACVGNYYSSDFTDPLGALHWRTIVHNLVFKDYPITQTLGDEVTGWAANKSLLLAGSLLTGQVVLNRNYDQDNNYYQACLAPSSAQLNGKHGATCFPSSLDSIPEVSPVTFSRIPTGLELKTPPFLSALSSNSATAHFNIGYTDDTFIATDTIARWTTLQNPLNVSQVLVMDAAATSSAALGFGACANVSGGFDEAYALEDEALSFQLVDSVVQYADPEDKGVESLAEGKFVRIADGGPVDNSAVAQLVHFLQQNEQDDDFNIIAFDNVQAPFTPAGSSTLVGIDIANLFGQGICRGNQFCGELHCGAPCVTIPKLQIFVADSLSAAQPQWMASKSDTSLVQTLVYTKYRVTTIHNSNYGITSGSNGTLHAFSCIWANADTAPENEGKGNHIDKTTDEDFNAYADMVRFISSSMQADNGTGQKLLDAAFGLHP